MRIDRSNPLDARNIADPAAAKLVPAKVDNGSAVKDDLELQAQQLKGDAMATPEVDLQKVQEAARLLQSGQLDSPDAINRAAQNILDFGL